jgi:hypothetical protein
VIQFRIQFRILIPPSGAHREIHYAPNLAARYSADARCRPITTSAKSMVQESKCVFGRLTASTFQISGKTSSAFEASEELGEFWVTSHGIVGVHVTC